MKLFNLEKGLYCVQSGVFLTKLDINYYFLFLLSLTFCERAGKITARMLCLMHQSVFRPIYIFDNDAYFKISAQKSTL